MGFGDPPWLFRNPGINIFHGISTRVAFFSIHQVTELDVQLGYESLGEIGGAFSYSVGQRDPAPVDKWFIPLPKWWRISLAHAP